jgi:putative molybdopterin biosynthesis protein
MSSERSIYLETVPIPDAVETLKQHLERDRLVGTERVPTHEAAGRTTAEPVFAHHSSPTYHSAAMDGIAVQASRTFAAREGSPVELKRGEDFRPVNTGDPMPEGTDAVIMIEHVDQPDEDTASIEAPAFPWQHVRRIGEDIVATELILPQNHALTSYDIGALLSGGIWEVEAIERPHVYIVPTGDEVLDFRRRPDPGPGQVIESNSQVLASLAAGLGCRVTAVPPVPDTEEDIARAVEQGLDSTAHAVIIGAGSSAGSKDFTRKAMERYGRVLVHGIAAMPGKPSLLGTARGKLLVGAPGYPVSSVVCFEQLVQPLLAWLFRLQPPQRPVANVRLTRKMPSKLGQEEFLRLSVGRVGDAYVGTPLARGAGLITSLTRAQGVARIPAASEGEEAGRSVLTELLVPESELESILICVGSHDNTLDLLANELMGLDRPLTLSSTHVGSMGGISALRSRTAHLAGSHLYDPDSGDFNFPFLARYAPEEEVDVVNLAVRHQGLIVAPGNPKGIGGLEDLTRPDVRYINRQRSAGTRILLDDRLRRAGIDARDVTGYEQEEYTHMAVAANVLSGAADCGMGIHAAARALGLDFVPLARERYDLLIPRELAEEPKIRTLLQLIRSEGLQRRIEQLGGYETHLTGRVMRAGEGLPQA